MSHEVKFHIGTSTVVCTCGEYFGWSEGAPRFGHLPPANAVEQWAAHLRLTERLDLQSAYDAGWSDACSDWTQQAQNRRHPIGASRQDPYRPTTDPSTLAGTAAEGMPSEREA